MKKCRWVIFVLGNASESWWRKNENHKKKVLALERRRWWIRWKGRWCKKSNKASDGDENVREMEWSTQSSGAANSTMKWTWKDHVVEVEQSEMFNLRARRRREWYVNAKFLNWELNFNLFKGEKLHRSAIKLQHRENGEEDNQVKSWSFCWLSLCSRAFAWASTVFSRLLPSSSSLTNVPENPLKH